MYMRNCSTCSKEFLTSHSVEKKAQVKCYDCTLESITEGRAPEEGDFNTAALSSGTMTDQEWQWLKEDLRAVEGGGSPFSPYEDDDTDYYDPAWDDPDPEE